MFGEYNDGGAAEDAAKLTRLLATSLAANILAYRDDDERKNDDGLPLHSGDDSVADYLNGLVGPDTLSDASVSVPDVEGLDNNSLASAVRYLGIEPQPFILEAFFAHVYSKANPVLPPINPLDPLQDGPNYVVTTPQVPPTTVIVVQIANPFDRIIDLSDYKLSVYGRTFTFPQGDVLGPAIESRPSTAVVWAMEEEYPSGGNSEFGEDWRNFLDIANGDAGGNDDARTC